ncbi:MAG: Rieske 2Fe-2S domain-containing protein [Ilumatobacteraceae bacterium]
MFLRNAWYAAGWEREIGDSPVGTRLLGENVVMFRRSDGSYAALQDACPHRKLPLSMGRVQGDVIECGYHGMMFDCSGACTKAPTNNTVPPNASVRAYPIQARYGLLWIWMGDPDLADPATIFEVRNWGEPGWGCTAGDDMIVACNYLYIVDNLLDPTHVAWVHQSSFAGAGTDDTPMQVSIDDVGVTTWRWLIDTPPAPFYAPYLPFEGNTDRKQQYEVRYPAHALIAAIFAPAGTGGEGRPQHPDTFLMDSYNFLTPVDESTTHYFWFQTRNVMADDEDVSVRFAESVRAAFSEDKVVLEAVQRGMAADPSHLNLRNDTGGVRFRRRLAQLIEAEQAAELQHA